MTDAQLQQLCAALGWQSGTFDQALHEVARLRALAHAGSIGLHLPPTASPADIGLQIAACEAFAGANNWSPLR